MMVHGGNASCDVQSEQGTRGNVFRELARNRRILLVDDNPAIHEDFRKILLPELPPSMVLEESAKLFLGESPHRRQALPRQSFEVDSAFQGEEAVTRVREAQERRRPYAMAFVDVRMPPGLDGIGTIARMWEWDPDMQIVICTAYSDYSWEDVLGKLRRTDGLIILKKPFDVVEVLQLAEALTERWRLGRQARCRLDDLERMLCERTAELAAATDRANATASAAMASQVALEEILQSLARNDTAGMGRALGSLKDASARVETSVATRPPGYPDIAGHSRGKK